MAFLAGLLTMAGGGYLWLHASKDELAARDEPAPDIDRGLLRRSETIAVGEVVNSIRSLNRLVVFQSYVMAATTTHEIGWLTQSDQTMLTPAFVNYYVDMNSIGPANVRVRGKDIFVARPAIIIERPNIDTRNIQIFNAGLWTNLSGVSDRMRMKNNRMALRQLMNRAKMPFLRDAARNGAAAAIETNIRSALVAAGRPDLIVHVVK